MLSMGLNVQWFAKCKYMPGQHLSVHLHNFYHYIYVVNGTGQITIGDKEYMLEENNLYLTPMNVSHSFTSEPQKGLQVMEIKFVLSDESMIEETNKLPCKIDDPNLILKHTLETIVEKGIQKSPYYKDIINLKYAEMLINLFKRQATNGGIPSKDGIEHGEEYLITEFEPVISYMRKNMHLSIELESLAKIMNLNPSYFCKLFRDKYGVPPIHFLNDMRLTRAKELLQYSDMNITQISYEIGFQSIHYFSRFFTIKEKISPHEYRQKLKDNVFINVEEFPLIV